MARYILLGTTAAAMLGGAALMAVTALAQAPNANQANLGGAKCPVSHSDLERALKQNVHASGGPDNGGLPVNEWGAVVNRDGVICAIAYSGNSATDQWLGSRAIAIEKANTVNAFGLKNYAISTANLWAPSQPGGSLFGLDLSNPPMAQDLYAGDPSQYGTLNDPLLGKKPGGVMVFGGGLALYDNNGIVGGLGASGNTSCADHNIAWRVRHQLGLDHVPNGPSPQHNDEIIYDVGQSGVSQTGWGHPECGHNAPQIAQQIGAGIVMVAQQQPSRQGAVEGTTGQAQSTPPAAQPQNRSATNSAPPPSPTAIPQNENSTFPAWLR